MYRNSQTAATGKLHLHYITFQQFLNNSFILKQSGSELSWMDSNIVCLRPRWKFDQQLKYKWYNYFRAGDNLKKIRTACHFVLFAYYWVEIEYRAEAVREYRRWNAQIIRDIITSNIHCGCLHEHVVWDVVWDILNLGVLRRLFAGCCSLLDSVRRCIADGSWQRNTRRNYSDALAKHGDYSRASQIIRRATDAWWSCPGDVQICASQFIGRLQNQYILVALHICFRSMDWNLKHDFFLGVFAYNFLSTCFYITCLCWIRICLLTFYICWSLPSN